MSYLLIFMFTFGGGFLFAYGLSHNLIFCLFGGILFGFGLAMATESSQRNAD
jgi:hypothetical protein